MMSGRRKSSKSKKSLNGLFDEAGDISTPRTLLLNALKEPEVQQTVKKPLAKRRSNVKKKTASIKESQDSSSWLETSVTPRTALQNMMAVNEVMATAAHPRRPKRSPITSPKDKKNALMDRIYQPIVTQQELAKRLREKLDGLKKVAIRSEPHGSPDEPITMPDDIDNEHQLRDSPVEDATPRKEDSPLVEDDRELIMEDSISSQHNDLQDNNRRDDGEVEQHPFPRNAFEASSSIMADDHSTQPSSSKQPNNSFSVASALQNDTIPPSESELTGSADPLRLSALHQDKHSSEVIGSEEDLADEEKEAVADEEDAHHASIASTSNRAPTPEHPSERIVIPSLRRLASSKVSRKRSSQNSQSSIIPRSQLKGILEHHSAMKIRKEAVEVAETIFTSFFKRLCEDMEAVTQFAGRASVNKDDLEIIMKRQRFITKDKTLNMLIREHLPLEYQQLLIEEATCVSVPPKKKKK